MKGKQELMASQGKEGYMLMNFHEQRVARRIINAHINAWPRFFVFAVSALMQGLAAWL